MASINISRTYPMAQRTKVKRHASNLAGLSLMELRKLAHRPMVWAIFALPAALAGVYFPIAYLTARSQGNLASVGPHLYAPGYIEGTFSLFSFLGPICVAVLAAGLIGSDYGWGMMRGQVGTGVSRAKLLGGKIGALWITLAAWIVSSLAAASVSSIAVTVISGHPLSFGQVDATWFGDLGLMFGRTWLLLAAWMSIALVAAVVGRSLAAGIAVPIVWQVLEGILSQVVGAAGSLGAHINDVMLMTSARTFDIHNVFGPAKVIPGTVSQAHATVVISSYILLTLVIALVVFVRRDVTASV